MRFLFWLLCFISSLQAMSRAPQPVAVLENVGVRTIEYKDEKRKVPVVVELWYPTSESGPLDEAADAAWIHPKEVRNGALASGKYPLIVMSHGHGGDRRDRSWLADHLVKRGYIVASVEHFGNTWKTFNPAITIRFWERARDVSFAINQLLTDPNVKQGLDAKKIGFVGYSLGGMTGLALGGAKASQAKEVTLAMQELKDNFGEEFLQSIDYSDSQMSYAEPRVKAMVLLTPAAYPYTPESLKEIKVPVALIVSKGDEILPFQEHAKKIIDHLKPSRIKLLKDQVSHYVFLNRVSKLGKQTIKKEVQDEAVETDRLTVHNEVAAFVSEFFKDHLK